MRSRVIFAVLVVLMTLLAGTIYAGGGDTLEVTQERGYRIEVVTEKDLEFLTKYEITIAGSVEDITGKTLDGNKNGKPEGSPEDV